MRVLALLIGALLLPVFIPAAAPAQTPGEKRVWDGFMKLGMSRDKAWCYSQVIGKMLDQNEISKAAAIVEGAPNSEAVEQGVVDGGMPMMSAFSAAHDTCG
jgi:hypothetical protein